MWFKVIGTLILTFASLIYGLRQYEADMIIPYQLYNTIVFMISFGGAIGFWISIGEILDDEKRNIIGGKR